jgi:hypothetical protein
MLASSRDVLCYKDYLFYTFCSVHSRAEPFPDLTGRKESLWSATADAPQHPLFSRLTSKRPSHVTLS